MHQDFHITLIRPPVVIAKKGLDVSPVNPAMEMAFLAGVAERNGYKTYVIDALVEGINHLGPIPDHQDFVYKGLPNEEIIKRIPKDTNLIGFTCMFSAVWPHTRSVIEAVKKARPEISIILGGEHISALPEYTMQTCPAIEVGFLGEGEEAFVEFLNLYSKGEEYRHLTGLIVREGDQLRLTEKRKRIKSIDQLPWPMWEKVGIRDYIDLNISDGPYRGRSMPIMATRGCPYKCAFCTSPDMWGTLHIARNHVDVVDEIESYMKTYSVECIEFLDLTAIVRRQWIIDFCQEIIRRKLKFSWQISGGTRSEGITQEVLLLMKEAGCKYLCLVPESGSQATLDRIGKKVDLKRITGLMKDCIRIGLDTRANLVIGFPDETRKDIWKSLIYHQKLAWMGVIDTPLFIFSPYPGSRYFMELRKSGVITDLSDSFFYNLGMDIKLAGGDGFCRAVGVLELRLYQIIGMSTFYATSYLTRPIRLFRFLRNMRALTYSNSTFESRIQQNIKNVLKAFRVH